MSKYACDVPAPHRGPEGDALHWHAWEGQAEVLEQKAVDLELERLAAAKAREVARESMSPEDAALDKAMEGEEERVRLIELAASPSQEQLRQSLALGELKGMLTETEAEATERADKEFEGQYNASNSSKSLHSPREHAHVAKMQTATASQGEDLTWTEGVNQMQSHHRHAMLHEEHVRQTAAVPRKTFLEKRLIHHQRS